MANFLVSFAWKLNSIVVDDVDGDGDNSTGSYSDSHHHQFYFTSPAGDGQENEVFDDNADARSDISQCSKGSRGSTSREESESRLQQIKVCDWLLMVRLSFSVSLKLL